MRHHGEPDYNGNKRYLRADAQNDILFDPLVGMNPAMKSLKRPQRFIREVGVNGVEGIGQHGPPITTASRRSARSNVIGPPIFGCTAADLIG